MHLIYRLPRSRSPHPVLGGVLLAACAFLLGARPTEAHVLDAAVATPDCGTNTIQLHLTGTFMANGPFSVPYTITFSCSDGGPAIPAISDTATGTVMNATPGGYRPAPRRGAAPTAQLSGQPVWFNPSNVSLVGS